MQKLTIEGNLTTEKALEWKNKLNQLALSSESLELDLTKVYEADIVGVNAIISTYKLLQDSGKKMSVKIKKNSEMHEMLHLTKFLGMLPIN